MKKITAAQLNANILAVLAEHGEKFETIDDAAAALPNYIVRNRRKVVYIDPIPLNCASGEAFRVAEVAYGHGNRDSECRRKTELAVKWLAYSHYRANPFSVSIIERLLAV